MISETKMEEIVQCYEAKEWHRSCTLSLAFSSPDKLKCDIFDVETGQLYQFNWEIDVSTYNKRKNTCI